MANPEETLASLQDLVDSYVDSVEVALNVFVHPETPTAARKALGGALNYVLDLLDIFPDHYKGIGVVDDAMLLRIAAKQAIAAGAQDAALEKLAASASVIGDILGGELADTLGTYVERLPTRSVRGLNVEQILAEQHVTDTFANNVRRQVNDYRPALIDASKGVDWILGELRRMTRHELKKHDLGG